MKEIRVRSKKLRYNSKSKNLWRYALTLFFIFISTFSALEVSKQVQHSQVTTSKMDSIFSLLHLQASPSLASISRPKKKSEMNIEATAPQIDGVKPGDSIGSIRLGDTSEQVHEAVGVVPDSSDNVKNGYSSDIWEKFSDTISSVTVLYKNDKVLEIDAYTSDSVCTAGELFKSIPNLKRTRYDVTSFHANGDQGRSGTWLYLDDLQGGITYVDKFDGDLFLTDNINEVIVHSSGTPSNFISPDADIQASTKPSDVLYYRDQQQKDRLDAEAIAVINQRRLRTLHSDYLHGVVPGKSIGEIKLGDTMDEVNEKIGMPDEPDDNQKGFFLGRFDDPYSKNGPSLYIVYKGSLLSHIGDPVNINPLRVIEIELHRGFNDDKPSKGWPSIGQVQAEHRHAQHLGFGISQYDRDGSTLGGYDMVCLDEIRRGISYNIGAQDDIMAKYPMDSIIVHQIGKQVRPREPHVKVEPITDKYYLSIFKNWQEANAADKKYLRQRHRN